MQDISNQTTLDHGHPWPELKELIHEQMQKSSWMVHAAQEVVLTKPPPIELRYPKRSASFNPIKAMHKISKQFDANQPHCPKVTPIDRDCPVLRKPLFLELRPEEDLRRGVSPRGHMT